MAKPVILKFIGDTASLEASFKKVQAGTKGLESSTTKTSSGFKKLGTAAKVASVAVLGMGAVLVKGFVQAGMNAETTQTRLNKVLENTHQNSAKNIAVIDKYAAAEKSRGFSADEVRDSLTRLITSTHNVTAATRLSGVASDLARAKNISLTQAADIMARAHAGQFRALKSLGIIVPKVTTAQDALKASTKHATDEQKRHAIALDKTSTSAKALALLEKNVHGQAEAFASTDAGKVEVFKASWQNLQQSVGEQLIPVLTKLLGIINSAMNFISAHKAVVEKLAIAIGGLAAAVLTVNKLVSAWKAISSATSAIGTAVGWITRLGAASTVTAAEVEAGAAVQKASWLSTASSAVTNAAKMAGAWLLANPPAAIAIGIAAVGGGIAALAIHMLSAQSAMDRLRDSMNNAATAATTLSGKLETLKGANLDVREAVQNHRDALNHLKDVQAQVANGSLKGADAQSALAHAQIDAARTAQGVTSAHQAQATAVRDAATAARGNIAAINDEVAAARRRVAEIKNSISPLDHSEQSSRRLADAQHDLAVLLARVGDKAHASAGAIRDASGDAGKAAPAFQTFASKTQHAASNLDGLLAKLQNVSSVAPKASADARTIGSSIVQGVVSGIHVNAPLVSSAIQSILQAGVDAGKAKLKIKSPSKVMADEIGSPMGQGIIKGLLAGAHGIADAVSVTLKAATGAAAKNVYPLAEDLGKKMARATARGIASSNAITDAYKAIIASIKGPQDARAAAGKVGDLSGAISSAQAPLGDLEKSFFYASGGQSIFDVKQGQTYGADGTPSGLQPMLGGQVLSPVLRDLYDQLSGLASALSGAQQDYTDFFANIWADQLQSVVDGVPKLASGGVVDKPTLALIGEAGPEAIVPLGGRGRAGAGTTVIHNHYATINTAADGAAVIRALDSWERSNGRRYARAS